LEVRPTCQQSEANMEWHLLPMRGKDANKYLSFNMISLLLRAIHINQILHHQRDVIANPQQSVNVSNV
jgi:hypothetical protein